MKMYNFSLFSFLLFLSFFLRFFFLSLLYDSMRGMRFRQQVPVGNLQVEKSNIFCDFTVRNEVQGFQLFSIKSNRYTSFARYLLKADVLFFFFYLANWTKTGSGRTDF